jgi:cytoplasmic iron level regulating protein YaaA (DUF328/UPF0246 family)
MLLVLSPAKTLDFTSPVQTSIHTTPEFSGHASKLVAILRQLTPEQLAVLMKISLPLAVLNAQRFQDWSDQVSTNNAKQAMLAFNGDVYDGLQARECTSVQLGYLQRHLRILSGLYGVLRPLDMMQPYRLEMGTRLVTSSGQNLYSFWNEQVTFALASAMQAHPNQSVINLASEEYFKVVRPGLLKQANIITPVFEDWKNGEYKVISFFAKRARGRMVRYAAQHQIKKPDRLKQFDDEGYCFDDSVSTAATWRFRRRVD